MPGVARIMHLLRLLTVLVLGAAKVSNAATTILAGCQTGTTDTTYTPPSDGGEYEALGCRFDRYFSLNSPASLAVTSSTSVLVSGGGTATGIQVAFPATYQAAQSMGVLHYTVRDVAFGDNAMLVFIGAMPANSSVVLSNNTFSFTGSILAAIRIGAAGDSLQLNNSRLLVINNIATSNTSASFAVVFTAVSSISVRFGSLLSFSNNTLRDAAITSIGAAVYLDISTGTGFTFAVSNFSCVQMDGNVVSSVTAKWAAVVYWHSIVPFNFTVDQGSYASVNLNTASTVTAANGFQSVFFWRCEGASSTVSISVSRYSTFSTSNNSGNRLCSHAVTAAVWWSFSAIDTVSISLDIGSTMAVSDNSILHTTCPPSDLRVIYFDYSSTKKLNISVDDRSRLATNSNMMRNASAIELLLVVHWIIDTLNVTTFAISNHSLVSFSNNTASGVSSGDNMHGVYIDLGNSDRDITVKESSILAMDCNSFVRSQSTGSVLVVGWGAYQTTRVLIDLANNSTISMNDNFLRNHTSESGAVLVYLAFSNTDATVQFPKLFTLANHSNIVIQGNSAYASSSKGVFTAVYWLCKTLFTLQFVLNGRSGITVSGNKLHDCTAATVTSVLLSITELETFELSSNHSSLSFSNNSIYNTTSQGSLVSVQWNLTAAATRIALANGSLASFSGNAVINSTSADVTSVVQCSFPPSASISVVWGSTWRMTSNMYIGGPPATLASVATIALLCAGCKLLAVDSAIQIEGNTLKSSSTVSNGASLVELQCTLSLEGESKLSIRDNEYFMVSSSGAKPGLLLGSLSLAGTAALDMSHNAFTATATGPCPPPMATIVGLSSSMPQRSSVTVSTNSLSFNTSVPSSSTCPCLSIGSLASGLTVHSNTVSSNASNTTLVAVGAMSVPSPGMLKIAENSLRLDAPGGSLLAVSSYLTLEGRSGISVVDNRVTRLSAFAITAPLYYLVTAMDLNMSASQTALTVCGNIVYGDGSSSFKPDRFLMPPSMVNITKRCSITSSGSYSPSASKSPSITDTSAVTDTESSISSLSLSGLPSAIESPRRSNTDTSAVTDTESSIASHSITKTASRSLYPISQSMSFLPKPVVIRPVPAAVETAKKVRDVAGVAVAVMAVASVAGGQLGVANAMLRLADCSGPADDDELPILVHPLRFSFGDRKYQRNAAGAVSDTLLVPLIVVAIALGPARLLIMWSRSVPSRAALVQMGWPTLLVLPFANLAEGIGATTVTALGSGEPFGVGMGLVALLVLLAFAGSWAWILARVVPLSRLQLVREEGAAGLGKRRAFLRRMVRPSHRWVPLPPAEDGKQRRISLADVERHGNAVGDKQWYYAEFLSFLCSLAVGVCEGLPSSLCRERAVIALLPSLLQCVLAVLALIPLERFLQSLLALCLVPMYVVVAVKVFSDSASDEQLETVMAVLSTVGNVIGLVIMSLGLAVGLWEIATSHRAERRRLPSPSSLSVPMLDIDVAVDTAEPEQFSSAGHPTYSSYESPPEQQVTKESVVDPPSTRATTRLPIPQRPPLTMAEVLDYVEQAALTQRLEAELL